MAFNVVALGEKLPPAPPSFHVPVEAEPLTDPPNAAEVPPLQIAAKSEPALAIGAVQPFKLIPE